MKIATWNLQRPSMTGARVESLRKQIGEVDADVWILTETRDNIDLRTMGYHDASSDPIEAMHCPGERRTTIWSRYPIKQRIATHCPATAVCVELAETPIGQIIVYGTIIPYSNAGIRYAYHHAGRVRVGLKGWELHYESIPLHQKDLVTLKETFPGHARCFAGDFNQSRDGRKWLNSGRQWYGTQKGRELLAECLNSEGLKCVTEEDFIESGKLTTMSTVDHICIDHEFAKRARYVGAWDAEMVNGKRSSDHCGIYVKF